MEGGELASSTFNAQPAMAAGEFGSAELPVSDNRFSA